MADDYVMHIAICALQRIERTWLIVTRQTIHAVARSARPRMPCRKSAESMQPTFVTGWAIQSPGEERSKRNESGSRELREYSRRRTDGNS